MYAIRSYYVKKLRYFLVVVVIVFALTFVPVINLAAPLLWGLVITSYSIHYTKLYEILVVLFRNRQTIDVEDLDILKG